MTHKFALMFASTASAALMTASVSGSVGQELLPDERPGATLPVIQTHTYTISGRVRALLLWVGRDDVGSGVIRWRAADEGESRGYELLIGSDPMRAPGRLNKWGYLAEEQQGGEYEVVGVMSKSTEDGLGEVRAGLANPISARPFETIRGRINSHQAFARVATVQASSSFTYREVDAVLALAFGESPDATRRIDRPTGVRPGFLSSVAELIRTSIATPVRSPQGSRALRYVYGDHLYELRLLEAVPIASFTAGGRSYDHVVRGRFETGLAGGRGGNKFELVYGASGPLAEVPIVISYQPKWWLEVELTLES